MKYLKPKYVLTLGLLIGIVLFYASSVYAASISLTPQSLIVEEGQTLSLDIIVDPQGVVYTVKTALSFPPDILEAVSFTPANLWLSLAREGYDLTDNTAGLVIKTAGYPNGLKSAGKFGTLTFRGKKSGVANIQITGASLAYNAQNQNSLSGTQGFATVTINVASAELTSTQTETLGTTTNEDQSTSTQNETSIGTATPEIENQTAAVAGGFLGGLFGNWWLWLLLLLIIAGLIWYFSRDERE